MAMIRNMTKNLAFLQWSERDECGYAEPHTLMFDDINVLWRSQSVNTWLDWDELEPHLHILLNNDDWGLYVTKEEFDALPRDVRYRVVIKR